MVVFDMFREVLQRSKQLEFFDFYLELVIFTITGIAAHTPLAYPVKMEILPVVAHIFLKFFRRSIATF